MERASFLFDLIKDKTSSSLYISFYWRCAPSASALALNLLVFALILPLFLHPNLGFEFEMLLKHVMQNL